MTQRMILSVLISTSLVITSCAHSPSTNSAVTPVSDESREPSASGAETPWTTWSEKGEVGGLIVLSGIRKSLFKNNLNDPHVGYFGYKPVDCSKVDTRFRTADGSCTDLSKPLVGAAGVAFGRNVAPEFIDKKTAEKIDIGRALHHRVIYRYVRERRIPGSREVSVREGGEDHGGIPLDVFQDRPRPQH